MTQSTPTEPDYVMFQIGEGWSALYVHGRLDRVGDTDNVYERIAELLGVVHEESDVMQNVQRRTDAPRTLSDLRTLETEHNTRLHEAEQLRAQAAALLAEADALSAASIQRSAQS